MKRYDYPEPALKGQINSASNSGSKTNRPERAA